MRVATGDYSCMLSYDDFESYIRANCTGNSSTSDWIDWGDDDDLGGDGSGDSSDDSIGNDAYGGSSCSAKYRNSKPLDKSIDEHTLLSTGLPTCRIV